MAGAGVVAASPQSCVGLPADLCRSAASSSQPKFPCGYHVEIELLNFFKLYEFAQLVAPELWAEYERLRNLPFEELTAEDHAVAETQALEEAQKLGLEKGTAQFGKIRNDRLFVVWNRYHHKAEHLITKEIPDAITAEINSGRAKITALDASDKEVDLSKSQVVRYEHAVTA